MPRLLAAKASEECIEPVQLILQLIHLCFFGPKLSFHFDLFHLAFLFLAGRLFKLELKL